jgi:hypothetical protein
MMDLLLTSFHLSCYTCLLTKVWSSTRDEFTGNLSTSTHALDVLENLLKQPRHLERAQSQSQNQRRAVQMRKQKKFLLEESFLLMTGRFVAVVAS